MVMTMFPLQEFSRTQALRSSFLSCFRPLPLRANWMELTSFRGIDDWANARLICVSQRKGALPVEQPARRVDPAIRAQRQSRAERRRERRIFRGESFMPQKCQVLMQISRAWPTPGVAISTLTDR